VSDEIGVSWKCIQETIVFTKRPPSPLICQNFEWRKDACCAFLQGPMGLRGEPGRPGEASKPGPMVRASSGVWTPLWAKVRDAKSTVRYVPSAPRRTERRSWRSCLVSWITTWRERREQKRDPPSPLDCSFFYTSKLCQKSTLCKMGGGGNWGTTLRSQVYLKIAFSLRCESHF